MLRRLSGALALIVLATSAFAVSAEAPEDEKVKCIVAGKEISVSKAVSIDHNGGKVYVCCGNCKAKVKADAAKYAAKANHQLVSTGQAKQVNCPFAGKPVNPSKTIIVEGVTTKFCCGGCLSKVAKTKGDARVELVFNDKAFKKGFELVKAEEK